ncbi:MAG TPA: XRE family transcriptional regulator, partial [Gammaproteobacteria bacterium]|nr:XRE family transcriptional regulator [Gammaproteobacteria bacterium]
EEALLADTKLLLMTYLLINAWPLREIVAAFAIEMDEAERLLVRLHRAKIIELMPFNRVKLLTARNFRWRKNGPVQKFFETQVQRDFLSGPFTGAGAELQFVGGMLSPTGFKEMQQSIERIAREFDELARRDSALPLADRHACGAVFAIRPWEFSQFAALRRPGKR